MKFFSKKMLQKWSFDFGLCTVPGFTGVVSKRRVSPAKQANSNELEGNYKPRFAEDGFTGFAPRSTTSTSRNEAMDMGKRANSSNFIQIGLASSDEIKNWAERSYFIGEEFVEIGEVKRPDTLNYRTFKPEKDGLFCERIFGPVNDWTCSCGQIKEQRFALDHERAIIGKLKSKICPNCQVEVTSSRLRRYRMGYISLACPVTHIWYLNSRPSLFSILLKMPTKYIKKIAYYKAYSPSSLQREYMSSCLGPGGDFFDNEWEYLHMWLSGKHSIEDISSRRTQFVQSTQKQKKEKRNISDPLIDPSKTFWQDPPPKSTKSGNYAASIINGTPSPRSSRYATEVILFPDSFVPRSDVHPGRAGSASPNRYPGQDTLLTGAKRQVSGHFPRLPRRGRSPKRRDVRGAHRRHPEPHTGSLCSRYPKRGGLCQR